jgi:tetratricopeptide (TPR) repeat protein
MEAYMELASMRALQREFSLALELMQRVQRFMLHLEGPNGANVGKVTAEIGEVLLRWGRYAQAEAALQRALEIFEFWLVVERSRWPERYDVCLDFVLSQLERLYSAMNRPLEGFRAQQRRLELRLVCSL